MLVLTRKPNESIAIGEEISIVVISVQGNKVKLGIEAPRHQLVVRSELVLTDCQSVPTTPTAA